MSNRKYPRISATTKYKGHPNGRPICRHCPNRAVYKQLVQVNWFRGDDETVPVCEEHKGRIS